MRVLAALVTITLALLYTPAPARANGRFPKAQAIVTVPGSDGSTVFLRATFGVLVSRDGGATWRWLCEQALGFSSTWDPPIAATRDGRLWVALTDGARVTADGCAIDDVPSLEGELVGDLAVDGSGDRVFAITSTPGKPAFVWRGEGAGSRAFVRLGQAPAGFRYDTIEVAPSNAKRIYLTATPDGPGKWAHVFRSDDGGKTIAELTPVLPNDGRLFVSAVDPRDADRVYARQLAETGSDVLLSTDGGRTFRSVLHMAGAMFGFARTADGGVLYAGSGDPKEGIWRSVDRGATWEPQARTQVFCLNAEGPSLLVGSNPYVPGGYAIARSTDRGATIAPLATFASVLGPVACDGGPGACAASWPETRALIATGDAERAAAGDASTAPVADASATAPAPPRSSRCGCEAVGARPASRGLAIALAALAIACAVARSHRGSHGAQRRR